MKKDTTTDQSVTTVARHYIKQGKEKDFKAWVKDITSKAKRFEGFEGLQLISPPNNSNEYIVLFKYASIAALEKWMTSKERKEEVEKLDNHSEKEMVLGQITGIDFWFEAPDKKTVGTPPKWKMALLTWVGVFPGVVILSQLYHAIFPTLPAILLTLFVTLTLVSLLTWLIMPNLVKLFKKWIFKV